MIGIPKKKVLGQQVEPDAIPLRQPPKAHTLFFTTRERYHEFCLALLIHIGLLKIHGSQRLGHLGLISTLQTVIPASEVDSAT